MNQLYLYKNLKKLLAVDIQTVGGFPGGSDGKASVCNEGDPGLIPRSGRSPEKEMATHSSILAWKIPWTEKPGRLVCGVALILQVWSGA